MKEYADHINLITKSQDGCKKVHSTVDNIFVLCALISICFSFGKKHFCTFIDFKHAFSLFNNLVYGKSYISQIYEGKIYSVIHGMYQNIKTWEEIPNLFMSYIGVKQGENLSPFIFSLTLNDLADFFTEKKMCQIF